MFCVVAKWFNRVDMILSKSLPNVDVSVIGRYDVSCVGSLLGFGMTMMMDVLNACGICVVSRIALYMLMSHVSVCVGKCLSVSYVMRSGPGALLLLVDLSEQCSSVSDMSFVSSCVLSLCVCDERSCRSAAMRV